MPPIRAPEADNEVRRRVPAVGYVAAVDDDSCTGCGICLTACPMQAISVEETARVQRDLCIGCGICLGACPEEAITLATR